MMSKTRSISEGEVLDLLKILPENKKTEVIDFLEFLGRRFRKEGKKNTQRSVSAVNNSWGSIKLNKKALTIIAEDKELEYDV